ncbi:MAG: efflux RND transporter periplasmic adaptor subunit [Chloroflexi bacterium]|nr:efflux RND transporter periplasmic adaptor subunit [Chloroflexota bacterium]MCI0574699.1 efflux RND transporter periplasmic adaptor subunit [Chloroflexota bacterium]MCI0647408.1 efflux RND transporter periplasmic adaptor subunit [Chloroflexota bacterium]MCI0728887.1 efflux RND transporter periplasmic adaptor subunit [Chloroflexota bacterium]
MNSVLTIKAGLFLCLVLLAAGCSQGAAETANQPTPTPLPTPVVPEKPTYTVQRGTVVKTLEFSGRVSPAQEQELFFRTDGFVATVNVARGDRVQLGDVLAELEIEELRNQLSQKQLALQTAELTLAKAEQERQDTLLEAQITLEQLQLQLAQARAGYSTAGIVSGEVNLNRAQEQLAYAEYEYQKALDRPWEPQEVVDNYARELERAQENLRIAEAEYNDALASNGSNSYEVQILEQEILLAELKIEQLERGVDPLLALDVEQVQLEIAEIERQIADASLVAPFDGQILSIGVRPGDPAEAFTTVVVLAEPGELEITAELGSDQLSEMSVGQAATVHLRSRPEESLSGSVRQLPYPYGGGTVDTGSDDSVARITLDDSDAGLVLGELATVVIVLEEKQDVLWLPPAAIRTFQGRNFVVVQDGDGQRRVDVRLGIESADRVEILSGLEEGQIVVGE